MQENEKISKIKNKQDTMITQGMNKKAKNTYHELEKKGGHRVLKRVDVKDLPDYVNSFMRIAHI